MIALSYSTRCLTNTAHHTLSCPTAELADAGIDIKHDSVIRLLVDNEELERRATALGPLGGLTQIQIAPLVGSGQHPPAIWLLGIKEN